MAVVVTEGGRHADISGGSAARARTLDGSDSVVVGFGHAGDVKTLRLAREELGR